MSLDETPTTERGKARELRRFQVGVRGLIVAVACSGLVAWSARRIWEDQHPSIEAARGLRSPEPSDREAAVRQLLTLGFADPERAVPSLLGALDDPEARVRSEAAGSLGPIVHNVIRKGNAPDVVPGVVRGLIGALKDREPGVRVAAAKALLMTASKNRAAGVVVDIPAELDALGGAAGDPDESVRLAVLRAMAEWGPFVLSDPPRGLDAALRHPSPRTRAAAITALAAFPVSLDPWFGSVIGDDPDPEVRKARQNAIERRWPPAFSSAAIPALVSTLGHPSRVVRSYAIRALGRHSGEPSLAGAIPVFLGLLREPLDPAVDPARGRFWHGQDGWDPATEAATLLGHVAPRTSSAGEVIAALADVARTGEPSRRQAAAGALGAFGPAAEPAVPALIEALRDDLSGDSAVIFSYGGPAARSLGLIAPGTRSAGEAISALIEALDARPPQNAEYRSFETRRLAIEALPEFGSEAARALPHLRALGAHRSGSFKAAAEKAAAAIEATQADDRT